jgi:predicted nuclease of restriction endonuclease-like (RecB) superfamily
MNEKAKNELDTSVFDEVIAIIENARESAFRAVNRELINMYWGIGELVSRRVSENGWGKSVVKDFSDFIQSRYAGIKGFSPQNIWRMKQFYETYRDNEKLSPLMKSGGGLSNTNSPARTARVTAKNCSTSCRHTLPPVAAKVGRSAT